MPHDGSVGRDQNLPMVPTTRYARSGDATIAYQVAGEGALDLLFLPGWISQVEQLWEASALRRFLERRRLPYLAPWPASPGPGDLDPWRRSQLAIYDCLRSCSSSVSTSS
jgi:hypothetical protein